MIFGELAREQKLIEPVFCFKIFGLEKRKHAWDNESITTLLDVNSLNRYNFLFNKIK